MNCKNCGEPIQEGYSFCMNCGKSYESTESVVQMSPVEQPIDQSNTMKKAQKINNNQKLYFIIGGIVAVVIIIIVGGLLVMNHKKTSPSSNKNSQSNISSSSSENTNTNTNTNVISNSNSNSNGNNTIEVSGGEIEFNGYKFMIPSNYRAAKDHWEFIGDTMTITNDENYNMFYIKAEQKSYNSIKSDLESLREELSMGDYYAVGKFQYKTYNGKEYLVVSQSSKNTGLVHMIAYVALNDKEILVIDGTNLKFTIDYEIFSEVAPIIASAHK